MVSKLRKCLWTVKYKYMSKKVCILWANVLFWLTLNGWIIITRNKITFLLSSRCSVVLFCIVYVWHWVGRLYESYEDYDAKDFLLVCILSVRTLFPRGRCGILLPWHVITKLTHVMHFCNKANAEKHFHTFNIMFSNKTNNNWCQFLYGMCLFWKWMHPTGRMEQKMTFSPGFLTN